MAGPKALQALETTGVSIFLAGVVLTLMPHILGLIFGKWVLKLNPVLLFGAMTGAGTITAGMNSLKRRGQYHSGPRIYRPLCHGQRPPHHLGHGDRAPYLRRRLQP